MKKPMGRAFLPQKTKHSGVICPICNGTFENFGTFGVAKRPNAKCHKCNALERHRLLFLYMTEKFNLFEHSEHPIKVLHFAPEKVFHRKLSANKHINYFPCDLQPKRFKRYNGATILEIDITQIPFEDGFFDFILCNHVLEHIPDDRKAMSELQRVLSVGGSGIFQVPIDYTRAVTYEDWSITTPKARKKAFGQKDHVRWYGKDYITRLEEAGFVVQEEDYVARFSKEDMFTYGLLESERIYHCMKTGRD